jgi:mono/diheme cytochrome c family protein
LTLGFFGRLFLGTEGAVVTMGKSRVLALLLGCFVSFAAGCQCSKDASTTGESGAQQSATLSPEEAKAAAVKKGKTVYESYCIACHNRDPKVKGAIGPDVWGSSMELLEARVIHGKYPEGYTPKQTTGAMAALPFLKKDLEALHAFLNH